MVDVTKLIERLEALDREATKGPWTPIHGDLESNGEDEKDAFQVNAAWIEEWFKHDLEDGDGRSILKNEDADLLAETRNALPLLIAALKVAQAAVEQAAETDATSPALREDLRTNAREATEQAASDFAALCKQEAQP